MSAARFLPLALALLLLACAPPGPGGGRPADCATGGGDPVAGVAGVTGQLAFSCDVGDRSGVVDLNLFLLPPAGGRSTRLTRGLAQDLEPAWSPDGATVVFSSTRDGRQSIYRMDAAGGHVRRLTSGPAADFEPDWSPDGRWVVFASGRGGVSAPLGRRAVPASLYRVGQDGTGMRRLTYASSYDGDAAWSPDGSSIAFVSDRAGSVDVWIVAAGGPGLTRVTRSPGTDERPTWSPDGARLAFGRLGADGVRSSVLVVNRDGTGERLVVGDGREPAWSPDGRWIAFVSDRDGHANVYVASAAGDGRVARVTSDWAPKFRPAWRP